MISFRSILLIGVPTLLHLAPPVNAIAEAYYHTGFEVKAKLGPAELSIFRLESGRQSLNRLLPVEFQIGNDDQVVTAIIHGAINLGITDVGQISYALATAEHESAGFSTTQEIGSCEYFAYQAGGGGYIGILGNRDANDACKFSGKGLVQLTGRSNFERVGAKYGLDLVGNPALAERPDIAVTLLLEGMMGGQFTGLALPEFVSGDRRDYVGARRVVNGRDRAKHIARMAEDYEALVEATLKDYGIDIN